MIVKLKGPAYRGADGNGGSLDLKTGDKAEVSDSVGRLLLARYKNQFEEVAVPEEARMAPDGDKQVNLAKKPRIKLRVK